MWEGLQHATWVTTLQTTRWMYALVLVVHYVALFSCVGTILVLDLRVLGIANRNKPLSAFARYLRRSTWIGFAATVVSGFLLFATKAEIYAEVTPFRVKLLIIGLAVMAALAVEWSAARSDAAPAVPLMATLLALLSMVLWLGAILAAVEIPALTGIG